MLGQSDGPLNYVTSAPNWMLDYKEQDREKGPWQKSSFTLHHLLTTQRWKRKSETNLFVTFRKFASKSNEHKTDVQRTAWSRILPEKRAVTQVVKKYRILRETPSLLLFTRPRLLNSSHARWIQFPNPQPIYWKSTFVLRIFLDIHWILSNDLWAVPLQGVYLIALIMIIL